MDVAIVRLCTVEFGLLSLALAVTVSTESEVGGKEGLALEGRGLKESSCTEEEVYKTGVALVLVVVVVGVVVVVLLMVVVVAVLVVLVVGVMVVLGVVAVLVVGVVVGVVVPSFLLQESQHSLLYPGIEQ